MAERKRTIREDIESRVMTLYLCFSISAIAILLRLVYIQFIAVEVKINSQRIEERIFRYEEVIAHRGSILARGGEPLANSISKYQVEMDFGCEGFDHEQKYKSNSDSLAKLLAKFFKDRTEEQYKKLFREQREEKFQIKNKRDTVVKRSETIIGQIIDLIAGKETVKIQLGDTIRNHEPVAIFPRYVDYAEWEILRTYPILNWNMGMSYQRKDKEHRVYAFDGVARRTIGAINEDRGQDYGIEAVYNDKLKGTDGLLLQQRIARGFYGTVPHSTNKEAVEGQDVVTTIDVEVQDIAHSALQKKLMETNARWGTTVVMEVATGDILAIANLDRTQTGTERKYEEGQNRAIGARAEPGSTMKLATAMALMEVAKMPTTQIYDSEDGRRVKVGSITVQDSHKGHAKVALNEAFAQSLNVYFAKAIYENFKEQPQIYTDFLKNNLNLDKRVGFTQFGEPEPIIYGPEDRGKGWYPHSTIVSMATGYAMELTPMQILTLYNGFANEGRIVAPRLVSEIRNSNGVATEQFGVRTIVEQMCSRETLDSLKKYMVEVNRSGTGAAWLGKFQGFEVAAKTGTAQFAQGGLSHRDGFYIASMVGFMPADRPKYSVITTVHLSVAETIGRRYYGSTMAGEVMQSVMQQLFNREKRWHAKLDTIAPKYSVENSTVVMRSLEREELREMEEAAVEAEAAAAEGSQMVEVPYIYGLGLRDAVFALESAGLKVKVIGQGAVFRQSVKAASRVRRGTQVEITLR